MGTTLVVSNRYQLLTQNWSCDPKDQSMLKTGLNGAEVGLDSRNRHTTLVKGNPGRRDGQLIACAAIDVSRGEAWRATTSSFRAAARRLWGEGGGRRVSLTADYAGNGAPDQPIGPIQRPVEAPVDRQGPGEAFQVLAVSRGPLL